MQSIKTLLINPPIQIEDLYGKFAKVGSDLPPLSLCYLASYLIKHRMDVRILDAAKLRLSLKDIFDTIRDYSPDIIGFYTCTPYFNSVLYLSNQIKKVFKNILCVAGGPHFFGDLSNVFPSTLLDLVVIGEGEQTILDIVESMERYGYKDFFGHDIKNIQGIAYRVGEDVQFTSPREPMKDLDQIPYPARELLPPLHTYKVSAAQYKKLPATGMLTSRGCPFRCIFCVCSLSKQKVRTNSIEYIIGEVDELI